MGTVSNSHDTLGFEALATGLKIPCEHQKSFPAPHNFHQAVFFKMINADNGPGRARCT